MDKITYLGMGCIDDNPRPVSRETLNIVYISAGMALRLPAKLYTDKSRFDIIGRDFIGQILNIDASGLEVNEFLAMGENDDKGNVWQMGINLNDSEYIIRILKEGETIDNTTMTPDEKRCM